jgi:hypothetical protein
MARRLRGVLRRIEDSAAGDLLGLVALGVIGIAAVGLAGILQGDLTSG